MTVLTSVLSSENVSCRNVYSTKRDVPLLEGISVVYSCHDGLMTELAIKAKRSLRFGSLGVFRN